MNKPKDLLNKKFGKLLVIKCTDQRYHNQVVWECQCDCGNLCLIPEGRLGKSTKSCGCYKKERFGQHRKLDLTGETFGNLVTIRPTDKRQGNKIVWECKCNCGRTTYTASSDLRSGKSLSCGWGKCNNNYKHGKSNTVEYSRYYSERNSKRREALDLIWTPEMEKSLKKSQRSCVVCGSTKKLCIDHVYPFSKGYLLKPGNAVRLCSHCNTTKSDKLPEELFEEMRNKILKAARSFEDHFRDI